MLDTIKLQRYEDSGSVWDDWKNVLAVSALVIEFYSKQLQHLFIGFLCITY